MLNKCCFIGNLGRNPELRHTQDGKKVANFSIACTEKWKSATGERKERTEWVRIVCFNDGLVGVIEKYLRKGSKVYLEGQLQTRKWTDKDGNDKYTTEVVMQGFNCALKMLDGKPGEGQCSEYTSEDYRKQSQGGYDAPKQDAQDLDDEIPF